mgnify:CR=1 FL=1
MSDITFDRAPRFNELTDWVRRIADDHPDLVDLEHLAPHLLQHAAEPRYVPATCW